MKTAIKENMCKSVPVSKVPKRQQLYWIYKTVMNRRNFEYGVKHTCEYYLKCRRWRNPKEKDAEGNMRWKSNGARRDWLMNRAKNRLNTDLDVI